MISSQVLEKFLVDTDLVKKDQLDQLRREAQSQKVDLEDLLLEKSVVTEEQILNFKSQIMNAQIIELRNVEFSTEVLNLIPEPIARRHLIIAFAKDKEYLSLAMYDPEDLQTKEFIKKKTGLTIKTFIASKKSIEFGLSKYHSSIETEFTNLLKDGGVTGAKNEQDLNEALKKMAEQIPIIRVVDTLLEYAVFEKASDIHIEPEEDKVMVRYRIDGILHEVMTLPKVIQGALVARVKVLANLKIDEHRLPQDGRFKIEKDEYAVSLRVSTIPIFDGEKVVMRLLDESAKALTLEQLGFQRSNLGKILNNIKKPHGALLVTGPTGSGKSTTLYSVLSMLNNKNVNISTIEDPVEYKMVGVNQMQVSPKIGLTFAMGLRALLRQDPNIIMIGEIRDQETAEEAVHAAMTGHIVLSTLHTNSAAGALPRLLDMGIEPYLIASTVNAVIAQRLVRIICPDCIQSMKVDAETLKSISIFNLDKLMKIMIQEGAVSSKMKSISELTFYKGAGCSKCARTGYRGRVGIHEVLEVSPEVQALIVSRGTTQSIQDKAEEQGMILMWEDGFIKATLGITTIDEILRVSRE
ncbi:MAG: Tfp pilus assembly protein PilB, type pilus assembly protein PilB [Candidatus Doudnabacteria bacterium]|nr:Tfp pilus assembly protein PilB, type pilus assembly protein PilB [Candidatus Doudnabacteria bacterium]